MQWPPTRPGRKGMKFHLVAGGLQNGFRVNVHLIEDHRQFVDERDIEVALRILDHLGGLGT